MKKSNTFEDMETQTGDSKVKKDYPGVDMTEAKAGSGVVQAPKEISTGDFSDTAVGDKVKYIRPVLDGKEETIEKFQVFQADTEKDPKPFQTGDGKYWPITMCLYYDSKNDDDVQNREYISGARAFVQDDGSPSEISFWYDGSKTQSAYLWEKVAAAMELEAKELSPRQFVGFLNMKPKTKVKGIDYDNFRAPAGAPKKIKKNMPGDFITKK